MHVHKTMWKPFIVGNIFSVKRSIAKNMDERIEGCVPFVASGSMNNGVTKFCTPETKEHLEDAGSITVSPVDGSAFYQPFKFIGRGGAGSSILILRGRGLGMYSSIFVANMIAHACSSKFSYGRMGNINGMAHERIMLPVTENGSPNWDFMNSCMKSMKERLLARWKHYAKKRLALLEKKDIPHLEEKEWQAFAIGDLFTVASGKDIDKQSMVPGNIPFIGASSIDNGVTAFTSAAAGGAMDRLVLGVNRNGSVGDAFVHPYECLLSGDVRRLHLKNGRDGEAILLFCAMSIRMQKEKYSYGRKFGTIRMCKQKIMLPVDKAGEPDWTYMQQYIDNMMLKKLKQFLKFLEAGGTATAPEVQA